MSHRITAKVKVFNLDAVKDTLEEMGLPYREGGVWTGWLGRDKQPVDVLVPAGNTRMYGIGFRENGDGELEIVQESMGGTGHIVADFERRYTLNVAKRTLASFGYEVGQRPDGKWEARPTLETAMHLNTRPSQKKQEQVISIGRY